MKKEVSSINCNQYLAIKGGEYSMRKKMLRVAVMTFTFFLMIGTGYAAIATISVDGPFQVGQGAFSFDINVNDIGMTDIDI
jgi:hypothetical protein